MAVCWNIAQALPLVLLCVLLHSQYSAEAAYSPAVVRIDTGSSNGPFTDAGGNVWASDTDSNGGSSESVSASTAIANTEDLQATVYQTNHIGASFSYTFGPANGLLPGQTYTVALHFVELYFSSEQQRIFDVQISANGQMTQALTNFDIYYAAGDRYTAYTYEEDFTLGSDGLLSIYFAATKDQATVAGIEIKLPAVLRIDAGSTGTFQDELAPQTHVWQADNYFTGSGSMFQSGSIANAADGSAGVYRTYHNAPEFTYTLGAANGLAPSTDYTAVLHFAELPASSGNITGGDRLMDISAQGQGVFTGFDVLAEAGATNTAVREHFQFTTDQSGVVTITFQSVGSNPSYQDAILAGIEVYSALPSSSAPSAGPASGPAAAPQANLVSSQSADAPTPSAASASFDSAASPVSSAAVTPTPAPAAGPTTSTAAASLFSGPVSGPSSGPAASPISSPSAGPTISIAAASPSSGPASGPDSELPAFASIGVPIEETPTDGPAAGPSISTEPDSVVNPFLAMEAFLKKLMLGQIQLQMMPESMTETITQATGSYSAASPVASPAASPAAGPDTSAASPAAAPAAAPAASPAASPSNDMYKVMSERYMAGYAAAPAAAPEADVLEYAASPAAAPAPSVNSQVAPAAAPVQMPFPVSGPAMSVPAFLTAAGPAAGTDLHQLCQDLFSSYLAFVRFQAESILDTGILQPSELTQSYLNSISAQYPLPANQNPVTALLGAANINDYPECVDLTNLLQTYYDLVILLNQAGAGLAPAPNSGDSQEPATAPLASAAPEEAPAAVPLQAASPAGTDPAAPALAPDAFTSFSEEDAAVSILAPMPGPALAPGPQPSRPVIEYNGIEMPAGQACQLMTVDVSQAIMNTASAMCQASADICMQAYQMMSDEASTYQPSPADLLDMGISNPAACPKCVAYLVQDHILQSLLGLHDQIILAPGPEPMPTQVDPKTAPAFAPVPAPAPGPMPDLCAPRPVPYLVAPRYSAATRVSMQLQFPAGTALPSCAPGCLISLSCGQASLSPDTEGYAFGQQAPPQIADDGSYPLTLYFPFAANYPPPGTQPSIITSCLSYAAEPCDSSALTPLGDITFDATKPMLVITKVSEQFGNPTSSSTATRKLQQHISQPLFALMLFNFSKAITNFTADDILLTGGTVSEVIPVPDTFDYFVWVEVTPGIAALNIAMVPGSIMDAAGNILYSDPTSPQVFTVISSNGQFSGTITYPSPPPPPSTMAAISTAAAKLLSKGAIAGIVIGVFFGVLIVIIMMTVTFSVLRRRAARSLQRMQSEGNIVAGVKAAPQPKVVTFTGHAAPSKGP